MSYSEYQKGDLFTTRTAEHFLAQIKQPPLWAQALNVVGEAGEFAEAFRRYSGNARRSGSKEELQDELADVIISAVCFGLMAGFDIPDIVDAKWYKILNRGYGNQSKS